MSETKNDIFEMIENTKIKINKTRKNKKQSIKDFIIECENESNKIFKEKEVLLK
jgi:hypothetical protein